MASIQQLDYPNYQVFVVDNGSSDDSVIAIGEHYPNVEIIQTGRNLGYAGGNNAGIRRALDEGADFILMLNNDTVVDTKLLSHFAQAACNVEHGSILGAKIYFYSQPDILWFAGGRWNGMKRDFEHIGHGQTDSPALSQPIEVDYITGCALFASATTFKEVGLLDERFFLSYEETDWCYRAKAQGHKCIMVPNARLWHKISVSFGGADTPLFDYFMVRNRLLWASKHLGLAERAALFMETLAQVRRIVLPPFCVVRSEVPYLKSLLWAARTWTRTVQRNLSEPMNQATLLAVRDYLMGRFGNCPPEVRALNRLRQRAPS